MMKSYSANKKTTKLNTSLHRAFVFAVAFVITILFFAQKSFGQAASATWALTSAATASNSGNVSGDNQTGGSIGTMTYTANGVSANGFNTTAIDAGNYYQFSISPTGGNNLIVTSISSENSTNLLGLTAQIQYSFSPAFTSPQTLTPNITIAFNSTTPTATVFSSLSISVASGQTLYVRIFAWSGSTLINPSFRVRNFVISGCTTPTAFNVTGGGGYCSGGSGVSIGLDGSQSNVNYQLFLNVSTPVGSSVPGTGSPISFGTNITAAGTYTVTATTATGGCTNSMTGNATVTINPLPVASVTGQSNVQCFATSTGTIEITASGGIGPWSYSVNNGVGGIYTSSPTNPYTFTGLVANTPYKIRVKHDASGCESKSVQ